MNNNDEATIEQQRLMAYQERTKRQRIAKLKKSIARRTEEKQNETEAGWSWSQHNYKRAQ